MNVPQPLCDLVRPLLALPDHEIVRVLHGHAPDAAINSTIRRLRGTGWDEARLTKLRDLAGKGLSAAKIANEIGTVTRNGVISAARRFGITLKGTPGPRPGDGSPAQPSGLKPRQGRIAAAAERAPVVIRKAPLPPSPPKAQPVDLTLDSRPVDLLGLERGMCRWPLWADDGSGDRLYCGGTVAMIPTWDGENTAHSYCPYHRLMGLNANTATGGGESVLRNIQRRAA